MDLENPKYYVNRELSWLWFNERVLQEAFDKTNPLLERFKFLAISASNLDEFFMVRVSGLMDQVVAEFQAKDAFHLSPTQQLSLISKAVHEMSAKQYQCLSRNLLPLLKKEKITFLKYKQLNDEQKEYIDEYFTTTIFPILTPMAVDQGRPFPVLNNKALNMIIELEAKEETEENLIALVQVPTVVSRLIELPTPSKDRREFIFLEDVIKKHIRLLFDGYKVLNKYCFRITRNSDFEIDEEDSEDLLKEIENSVKRRKWGYPVRLECETAMTSHLREYLKVAFELDEEDIYEIIGPLDLTFWMGFSGIKGYDALRNKPYTPVPCIDFVGRDIFEVIREKDVLVHHPYESFDCVVSFVRAAANDPKVLAIKQTLYRVSGNSPIVHALIKAAENGKQVTVLVELKARFDEENNIVWARKLEKAGCHVVYGLVGLKTHCKVCLVVRNEDDGIRRYAHLGTGNYNDNTAKIYTDIGFFTCKESFGHDASTLFNLLTGYSTNQQWKKIAVAPVTLRNTFYQYIDQEKQNALEGKPAHIIAKMNSLVDYGIIQKLYEASTAGVRIQLIVRGICCLRPGLPNVSENITVVSIVDKYLEHSRIFYFENIGQPKIFLSSADWMTRNLDRRVEVLFPIDDPVLKERIRGILDVTLSDTVKLRTEKSDGSYQKMDRRGKESMRSQDVFSIEATQRFKTFEAQTEDTLFTPVHQAHVDVLEISEE